jgi:outer membrane protein assembly factor BamB
MFRPIIHDDVVYIGADGSVRAYALADGRLLDSFDTHGARVTCPLLLQEERLYFGDNKGSLRSLSTITPTRQTLLPRWETSRVGEYDARAALSNERVAFLSNDGEVALLDAASGQLLQEFRHGKGDGGGGIVASNNSLVVAHGREVACYAP